MYLDNNMNIGKQLMYYRKVLGIRASVMAKELGIGYNTIIRLEQACNQKYSPNNRSINIINKIIDYLDVRDKLNYQNDEYLDFILNKQSYTIKELVDKYGGNNLANMLDVVSDTLSRWIDNKNVISRDNYIKIKKVLDIK